APGHEELVEAVVGAVLDGVAVDGLLEQAAEDVVLHLAAQAEVDDIAGEVLQVLVGEQGEGGHGGAVDAAAQGAEQVGTARLALKAFAAGVLNVADGGDELEDALAVVAGVRADPGAGGAPAIPGNTVTEEAVVAVDAAAVLQ